MQSSGPAPGSASTPSTPVAGIRSALLGAASTLMNTRGVAQTSLDDVAAAANLARTELDRHFADKAELVRAVIERQLDDVLAGQPAIDRIDSWEGLERWVEDVVNANTRFAQPFVCPLGSLAVELKDDGRFAGTLQSAFGAWEARLAAGLSAIQDGGGLDRRADPRRLAASLLAALQGGGICWPRCTVTRPSSATRSKARWPVCVVTGADTGAVAPGSRRGPVTIVERCETSSRR